MLPLGYYTHSISFENYKNNPEMLSDRRPKQNIYGNPISLNSALNTQCQITIHFGTAQKEGVWVVFKDILDYRLVFINNMF